MEELAQEGAIQIFRELGAGMESVIVGVVGVLQFEVLEAPPQRPSTVLRFVASRCPYTDIRWIQKAPDTIDIPALSLTRATRCALRTCAAVSCCCSRARGTWIGQLTTTPTLSCRSLATWPFNASARWPCGAAAPFACLYAV